jgi:hypothetical protein
MRIKFDIKLNYVQAARTNELNSMLGGVIPRGTIWRIRCGRASIYATFTID